jgi:hypothetical protein
MKRHVRSDADVVMDTIEKILAVGLVAMTLLIPVLM